MDRRKFLKGTALGLLAVSSPISISCAGEATRKTAKSGHLNLSFKPYELTLRHAFNLAKSSRTTTPDVLVQLEYDGIFGRVNRICNKILGTIGFSSIYRSFQN